MPKATVGNDLERHDLVTLPEGYVVLRPLSYDQFLHRRDLAMKMSMSGAAGNRDDQIQMDLGSANKEVTAYEFQYCIAEHNLELDDGTLMQFPRDMGKLHPKIGQEIADLIDKMNTFEADLKN
jgi:hypothetical protein